MAKTKVCATLGCSDLAFWDSLKDGGALNGHLRELKEIKSLPVFLEEVAVQAQCVVRLLQIDGTVIIEKCADGPHASCQWLVKARYPEIIDRWSSNDSPDSTTCLCGNRLTILPIHCRDHVNGILTICSETQEKLPFLACVARMISSCLTLARNAVELWAAHSDVLAAHKELYRETESLTDAKEVPDTALRIVQKYIKADVAMYLPRCIDSAGWGQPVILNDTGLSEDWLASLIRLVMTSHDENCCPLIILPENRADYPQFVELNLLSLISATVFYDEATLGRLVFCSQREEHMLSFSDLALLETLGSTISLRIRDLRIREFKERFLERALHQINTPAHSVSAIARLLASKDIPHEEEETWLRDLNEEAERLARLAQQAREFSIIQKPSRPRARLSLNRLAEKISRSVQVLADQRQVSISSEVPDQCCEVVADEDAIYSALQNLVENALKFSPSGTSIRIILAIEEADYRISVIDQGPGVPEKQREVIFQEFVSIPRPGVLESSGLGLTIARAVVEAHGGKLNCYDDANEQGACFSFTIPKVKVDEG